MKWTAGLVVVVTLCATGCRPDAAAPAAASTAPAASRPVPGLRPAATPLLPPTDPLASLSPDQLRRWRKWRKEQDDYGVVVYRKPNSDAAGLEGWHAMEGFLTEEDAAEKQAGSFAERPDCEVVAVLDWHGSGYPTVLCWYYNDGIESKRLPAPPRPQYGSSLTRFLLRAP